jgi:hypothetical protein
MTKTGILLAFEVIRVCAFALASSSSTTPSQEQRAQMWDRMSGECSPIPAVNTKQSRPPREAVNAPISRAARNSPADFLALQFRNENFGRLARQRRRSGTRLAIVRDGDSVF